MNNILLLILLAHFLGDYPFQSTWIYTQKTKNLPGGIFHILDLLLAYLLCLGPFLGHPHVQVFILITLIIHFIQDTLKVYINRTRGHYPDSYILDQSLHILLAILLWHSLLLPISPQLTTTFLPQFYTNPLAILGLLGLILITYFTDVTTYSLTTPTPAHFHRNYHLMLRNALLYIIIFLSISLSTHL